MSPLYGLGDLGAGVRVAIAEFEPDDTADIAAYASCYHVSSAVTYTKVDGGAGTGAGSGEAALDIEDVMGLAPGAAIDVYQEPNGGDTDAYDLYSAMINASTPDPVVTTSWGLCELDSDNAELMTEQALFDRKYSEVLWQGRWCLLLQSVTVICVARKVTALAVGVGLLELGEPECVPELVELCR